MAQGIERRSYARYQPEVPIEIELEMGENILVTKDCLNDISVYGLSFRFNFSIPKGKLLKIHIPLEKARFSIKAEVVWCAPRGGIYDLGVKFIEPADAFKAKIYSQICRIEEYKQKALHEGRNLTFNEAAREWIRRYAAEFAAEYTSKQNGDPH